MKKTLLFLASLISGFTSIASHINGGELRYEYTGSAYKVELTLFTPCNGNLSPATAIVRLASSCSATSSITLTRYSSDTLKEMFCPSSVPACNSSSIYPLIIMNRYSAIIPTIAPCSNWKFSYTDANRSASISNLSSPDDKGFYLEAFLNNSAAPNSSPVFGTDPTVLTSINAATRPFQVLDIEGDSIAGAFYQPQELSGTPIAYNFGGYSLATPFGTGTSVTLNTSGGFIKTQSSNTGNFALATRIYDYRNGVMVGYSSRDWSCRVVGGADLKTPLPTPATSFIANVCPGSTNTLTFNFTDSLTTDSVYLSLIPQNSYTYTTTYAPGIGSAAATVTWTTPSSLNPATTPYYFIKIRAMDNNCPLHEFANYTVLVRTASCTADSVWPGDANADKIVNMYDPLFVALANNKTGSLRTGASTAWVAQACSPWTLSFNTGINIKHADCNGNGTVDTADLNAITANYGQVHLRGSEAPRARGTGVPELYFDHTGITAAPGATITIPFKLGNSTTGMSNMFGIAGRVKIENVTPSSLSMNFATTWIGNNTNSLQFSKKTSTSAIDWAFARKDQQNVSGQGQIGAITLTIPAGSGGQKMVLNMEGIKIIDAYGHELTAYNVLSDTISIAPTAIGNVNASTFSAVVVPNPSPANATLALTLQKAASIQLSIVDITGRNVWHQTIESTSGSQNIALPSVLRSGMYLLRVTNGNTAEIIKWLKTE